MPDTVDEVLQSSWQACDEQRKEMREQHMARIHANLDTALQGLEKIEKETLYTELPALEEKMALLLQRSKQFKEGVEMWRWKAQVLVETIEEKQRQVALMVEDASKRLENRAEEMRRRQEEELELARSRCERILQDSYQFASSAPLSIGEQEISASLE